MAQAVAYRLGLPNTMQPSNHSPKPSNPSSDWYILEPQQLQEHFEKLRSQSRLSLRQIREYFQKHQLYVEYKTLKRFHQEHYSQRITKCPSWINQKSQF